MYTLTPRLLLAAAATILALGGPIHAAAFDKAVAVLTKADLPAFYAGSFKGLWLADSATLLMLAMTFGFTAARPTAASRPVVMMIALIPAATAGLIYNFVGSFFAAHLLMAAAVAAFTGGFMLPSRQSDRLNHEAERI